MRKIILALSVLALVTTSCGTKKKLAECEAKNKEIQDLLNTATVKLNSCLADREALSSQIEFLKKNNSELINTVGNVTTLSSKGAQNLEKSLESLKEKDLKITRLQDAQGKGYAIDHKANAMMVEFLGTDLSRIAKELEKLQIILPKGSTIMPAHIEENIGFSKDYNIFELRRAIAERNQFKAYKIAQHFAQNPKENPLLMTTAMIFSYFSNLLQYHGLKDKSPKNVASVLKVSPYGLKDYDPALRNYPMRKVSGIVGALKTIDLKGKGVGSNAVSHADLLKEMLFHIFA